MEFPAAAVERAMTYQQVIMRALAGTWTWLKAADVLGVHPRSLRRWRARYERDAVTGLLDCRRRRPSHRTRSVRKLRLGGAVVVVQEPASSLTTRDPGTTRG